MEEGGLAQRQFLIRAGIIVGSGGLIFGYDIGVISGTLSKISDDFNLPSFEVGLVVAILYVGSILGSMFGGPLCDYLGRWKTIHIQNLLFVVGSLVTGLAQNLAALCIGRFIVGIASAVSGIADVPYLNEISPPAYRGILSSQYEIAVSIGVLVSFAIALALTGMDNGWRVAFMLPGAVAVLQSLGMFLLPESPRWLVEKGKFEKAYRALCAVYGEAFMKHCAGLDDASDDVPAEVREYFHAVARAEKIAALTGGAAGVDDSNAYTETGESSHAALNPKADQDGHHASSLHGSAALRALFQKEEHVLKQYRYPVYLIVAIQVLSQITGGNVIRNYAPTIFENGGVSTTLALVFNLLFGVVKTIATFLSIAYIDTTGRLTLLIYGIVMVTGGMLVLAISSAASSSGNISNVPAFVVGCALVYAGFGLGYGPVPWVLSAEMFPTLIRGRIMSISLIASNVAQLVSNFVFLPLTEGITTAGAFFLFVALNLITFVFARYFLVESKEIEPDEILAGLLERYVYAQRKLTAPWPAVLGPLLTCLCCGIRADEDFDALQAHLPTHTGTGSGVGSGGDSAKHVSGVDTSLTSPIMSQEDAMSPNARGYDSTGSRIASGGGNGTGTLNPLVAERSNSTNTHSGVGSSSSKLTLVNAVTTAEQNARSGKK